METKAKLVLLELISAIFGWIWILASIATLYFLALAIFSDSPWSRFFWAFGVGTIAKGLAIGILGNRQQIAFEADLIANGYGRHEARNQWLSRYRGSKV